MSAHVTPSLSAYLDGELPAAEQAAVRAHVARCEECAARLQELARLDDLARTLPVEAPQGYFDSLPGRVTARLRSQRRAWGVPAWAWATAAALVLAVITPLTLREAPAPRSTVEGEGEPPGALKPAAEAPVAPERPSPPPPTTLGRLRPSEPQATTPQRPTRPLAAVGRLEKSESPPLASGPRSPAELRGEADVAAALGGFAAEPPEAEEAALGDELREAGEPAGQAGTASPAYVPISDAQKKSRQLAQGTRARPAAATPVPGEEPSYEALLERSPSSLDEARELRESWRLLAASEADAARIDEARVRVIELGAAAWRLGGVPEDRRRLEADARAYLESRDARQAERVRRILAAARPE